MAFGNKTEKQTETKNKPIDTKRAGAISVSIWENTGKDKNSGKEYKTYSFSPQRGYKDKEGNWQNTTSFRVADLPKLIVLLENCYESAISSEKDEE